MADVRQSIFQQGLDFAVATLHAERAMVVYREVGLMLGLNRELVWVTGEISTGLMQMLLDEQEPMVMMDAAEDVRTRDQTSAILSALRSVIFVPIRDHRDVPVGFLYADHRRRAGMFTADQLQVARTFVEDVLAPQLQGATPAGAAESAPLDWEGLQAVSWL